MTIKQALKNLYTAMCGGTTDKDGTAAIIDDIADNYTDGGTITIDEVPTNGSENAVSSGGVFSALAEKLDGEVLTCDMTISDTISLSNPSMSAAEVIAAVAAGKSVIAYAISTNPALIAQAVYDYNYSATSVRFSGTINLGNGWQTFIVEVSDSGDVTTATMTLLDIIPSAAGNDGKVLSVNGNAYELVNPTSLSNAPYTIHITQNGTTFTTTETAAQIAAAAQAGKLLQGIVAYESGGSFVYTYVRIEAVMYSSETNYVMPASIYLKDSGTNPVYLNFTALTENDVFSYTAT